MHVTILKLINIILIKESRQSMHINKHAKVVKWRHRGLPL